MVRTSTMAQIFSGLKLTTSVRPLNIQRTVDLVNQLVWKIWVRLPYGEAYKKKEVEEVSSTSLDIKQGVKSTPICKTRPNNRGRIRL